LFCISTVYIFQNVPIRLDLSNDSGSGRAILQRAFSAFGSWAELAQEAMKKTGTEHSGSLINRILDGLLWSFFSTGSQSILSILVLIVLARLLTPKEFGIVNAALIVIGISTIFAQLGVGPAIVQRKDLEPRHLTTGNTLSIMLGFFLSGIIFIFSSAISSFFKMRELTSILQPLSVILVFEGASTIPRALLHRELKFKLLVFVDLSGYFFGYGIVGICLAFAHAGVWALVTAQLVQSISQWLLLLKLQAYPKTLKIEKQALRELSNFGGGFTLASIFNYFARNGDYLVVGRFLGAENLGLYSRAYKLMTVPATIFSGVADRVLFPAMAKLQNDDLKLQMAHKRNIAIVSLLSLPLSAAMIILAPEIITILLGEKWKGAIIPFRILSIGALFRASYKISELLARAKGSVYKIAFSQGAYCLLVITGACIGQKWGIIGVSWGVLFALLGMFFLLSSISMRLTCLNLKTFLAEHLPSGKITIVFLTVLQVLVVVLRDNSFSPLIIVVLCLFASIITLYLLYNINKVFFFGENGLWFILTVSEFLSKYFVRFAILNKNHK
jgi:PST family polysaccharide transporter